MANELIPVENQFQAVVDDDTEDDFKVAREAIRSSIEEAAAAVPGLVDLADQSQHPRSYEVLGQFLKMKSELGKDLMETAEKRQKVRYKAGGAQPQNVNNNLFITTAELQKLMKNGGGNA